MKPNYKKPYNRLVLFLIIMLSLLNLQVFAAKPANKAEIQTLTINNTKKDTPFNLSSKDFIKSIYVDRENGKLSISMISPIDNMVLKIEGKFIKSWTETTFKIPSISLNPDTDMFETKHEKLKLMSEARLTFTYNDKEGIITQKIFKLIVNDFPLFMSYNHLTKNLILRTGNSASNKQVYFKDTEFDTLLSTDPLKFNGKKIQIALDYTFQNMLTNSRRYKIIVLNESLEFATRTFVY